MTAVSHSHLLQPLRVVFHGRLQKLKLLRGPFAVRRWRVPLNHAGPARLVRSTLTALHLWKDKGVAALAVLHAVKLSLPLASSTSPLTVPVSGTHQANRRQQQSQMPTTSGKPHGSESKRKGHLRSRESANSHSFDEGKHVWMEMKRLFDSFLFYSSQLDFVLCCRSFDAGEVPGFHEVSQRNWAQALTLE